MTRPKRRRASAITTKLTPAMAATVKGMLARGDRQSDIAAYLSINQGRIHEINVGQKFSSVPAATELPEPGPYVFIQKSRHERAALVEEIISRISADLQRAIDTLRAQHVGHSGGA